MREHLIVLGHGANDPGGVNKELGLNERDWNRKVLLPALKKHAALLENSKVTFYDITKDMYQQSQLGKGAYNTPKVASVTEIHEDASSNKTATGGHVIISTGFNPDAQDLALANVIKKYAGWWGSVRNTQGINKRDNLLNLNVYAKRGQNYRLLELGFITNDKEIQSLTKNVDTLAKELIQAITGEKITTSTKPTPTPVAPKPVAPTKPKLLSATAIRDEVIAGKWGSGQDRINRLTKAGYNAKKVQDDVNKKLLGTTTPKKKTNQVIANEIYRGIGGWGNGTTRVTNLKKAGYDPVIIQNLVNKMFK
ncbi:N-acetylmuramoyl-L-alanine amidase [Jeotgalibaca porci]|uniref:N-acetylmuramoyl-L-alanine amidase n=1 Tax=Jeotgalibaca porci TaxID=1868793 RepID=UPI0035A186CC